MERAAGTVARGIRTPIIQEGDAIETIVVDRVLHTAEVEHFDIRDNDIVSITESIVARAQGNYASVDAIASDVQAKFGDKTVGVVFPILSRNRFAVCLRGIAKGAKKVVLMLSLPSDEVGNHLISLDELHENDINPRTDVLSESRFRDLFGCKKHPYTGVDYIAYYQSLIEEYGTECEIIFSNSPQKILHYTRHVLACDIHSRFRTKRVLENHGANTIYSLDDILTAPVGNGGYNEDYGLLGANQSTDESVKLFPRNAQPVVETIQQMLRNQTGKHIEVMVYGDGAFKDPVGQIWELADPVVSPAYTDGLSGTPNEIKLKYLADETFSDLEGDELQQAIADTIDDSETDDSDIGGESSLGTTPRKLTDLIGSLSDLTSGSGDKGTPVVYIQGYFDHYTDGK